MLTDRSQAAASHRRDAAPFAPYRILGPMVAFYPSQVAFKDVPFKAQPPELIRSDGPVTWSVIEAPRGFSIDPQTGRSNWPQPKGRRHNIHIGLRDASGESSFEWLLRVVEIDLPDPRIVSTRYYDFVVTKEYADWICRWGADVYADAYWEWMRDVIGHEPGDGKLVMRLQQGGAHAGNPAGCGTGFWMRDAVSAWEMGGLVWITSTNVYGLTYIPRLGHQNPQGFQPHLVPLTQVVNSELCGNDPSVFGLEGLSALTYTAAARRWRVANWRRSRGYVQWLKESSGSDSFAGDSYAVMGQIFGQLYDDSGPRVLRDTLRAMRVDGLPVSLYDLADTDTKKDTLLCCILSCAGGDDLRPVFSDWGFDVDDEFYHSIQPQVAETVASLPDEDELGWKRCPLNGRYYRLTPWPVHWDEAERMAQLADGHVATLRNREECDWIRSRFGNRKRLWLGLRETEEDDRWGWTSGEALTFEDWANDQPERKGEDCVAFHTGSEIDNGWHDYDRQTDRMHGLIEAESPSRVFEPPVERERPHFFQEWAPESFELVVEHPFEESELEQPTGWKTQILDGSAEFQYPAEGRNSGNSIMISSTSGTEAEWSTFVPVEPHCLYRLSGWIKCEGIELQTGAGVFLKLFPNVNQCTPIVSSDQDWSYGEVFFDSRDRARVRIDCVLGGWGTVSGRAWFDDIKVELVARETFRVEVESRKPRSNTDGN